MLKPRIKSLGWYGSPSYRWLCTGFGASASGSTPQTAYEKWRESRKFMKGYRISRAREGRLAREKRIREREERRARSAALKHLPEDLEKEDLRWRQELEAREAAARRSLGVFVGNSIVVSTILLVGLIAWWIY